MRNSLLLFEKYALEHFKNNQKVFEVGVTNYSWYRRMITKDIDYYYGDLINPHSLPGGTAVRTEDGYTIDAEDNTFDIVFHCQTIEHVSKIWDWVKEQARVLKSGGKLIMICPLSFPYHLAPIDCWRIYPDGMRALFDHAGLSCDLAVCENLDEGLGVDNVDEKARIQDVFCDAPYLDSDIKRINRAWDWEVLETIGIGTKFKQAAKP